MYIYWDTPNLVYSCDIREEAKLLPIWREGCSIGRADVQVAFEAIFFHTNFSTLQRVAKESRSQPPAAALCQEEDTGRNRKRQVILHQGVFGKNLAL